MPLFAAETITGKVVSVADGDTITVLVEKEGSKSREQVKVRLHGIDAPERSQDFGAAARNRASTLCNGQEVTVDVKDTDQYGRKVGEVKLKNGRNLNHILVEEGMAHWYARYAPGDATLKRLEEQAKKAKRGLWSRDDVITPEDYRKGERAARQERSAKKKAPEAKQPASTKTEGTVYITPSGKKYHRATCGSLRDRKEAVSRADAEKQGRGPCGLCKP